MLARRKLFNLKKQRTNLGLDLISSLVDSVQRQQVQLADRVQRKVQLFSVITKKTFKNPLKTVNLRIKVSHEIQKKMERICRLSLNFHILISVALRDFLS